MTKINPQHIWENLMPTNANCLLNLISIMTGNKSITMDFDG